VIRALTVDGAFRGVVVKNTVVAQTAQSRHGLEPVGARLLAQALASASLLASFLKGEERIVVEAEGDGPIATVAAEALQVGEVRGYVRYAKERSDGLPLAAYPYPLGQHGLFRVVRILYNHIEPVLSVVELQLGDIAVNLEYYFEQSEQIPTVVRFDVAFSAEGLITASAGLLVQTMPGAALRDIRTVEAHLQALPPLAELLAAGIVPEEILHRILPGQFTVLNNTPLDFFCRCSQERFKEVLTTLTYEEVLEMQHSGHNELVCQYCGERYWLQEKDFAEVLQRIQARRN
ncbi:MAG: Hsp33 family molecular chaperone HslO, partial [Bacteroidota bacterium]|nr:Hsp33 family molecular chaperone HslO [Bacteroidota bacterium]